MSSGASFPELVPTDTSEEESLEFQETQRGVLVAESQEFPECREKRNGAVAESREKRNGAAAEFQEFPEWQA